MFVPSEVTRDIYNISILAVTLWFLTTGDSYSSSLVYFHKKFPSKLQCTVNAFAVVMRVPLSMYVYVFVYIHS
jgi:hypothetical protein